MNKVEAISRVNAASDKEDIIVATFPYNICDICHRPKEALFVERFAEVTVEACGPCATKLQELGELLEEV